jgi:hypothetical protein
LERDAKEGVWIDIGDKKAIEKTSQALREGQPKLRKKMVELGQIPPDQLVAADHVVNPVQQQQNYGNGIYNPRQQQNSNMNNMNNMNINMMNNNFGGSQEFSNSNSNTLGYLQQQQLELEQQQRNQMMMMRRRSQQAQQQFNNSFNNSSNSNSFNNSSNSNSFNNNSFSEIPAPLRATSNNMNDFNEVSMLSRLSLASTTPNNVMSIPSWTPSISSVDFMDGLDLDPQLLSTARSRSRTSFNRGNTSSYGEPSPSNNNGINVPQQIGTTGRDDNFFVPERIGSLGAEDEPESEQQEQKQNQKQQQQTSTSTSAGDRGRVSGGRSGNNADGRQRSPPPPPKTIDQRRRLFAKMKSARTTNALSSRSITDGMPDIHMVDSQFSLLSNLSAHGSKHQGANTMDISTHRSKHQGANTMDISTHKDKNKESIGSEYIGVGSRRSLMSGLSPGLSKLSGHSDINNLFSTNSMSKKIGGGTSHQNVSSRSLAMSEFSGIDEEFAEDDFSFELPPSRTASRTG